MVKKHKRFSIGWDGRKETIDVFLTYRDVIHDVYFVAPGTPSGRNSSLTRSCVYAANTKKMLQALKEHGIKSNILFNGLCAGELTGSRKWAKQIISTLEKYSGIGITEATCTSITDMLLLKKYLPHLTVHASVNMFIDSVAKCAQIINVCDVINIAGNMNYNLAGLQEIREFTRGKKLKLLVNEGCLTNCVHRIQHFNALAHNKNIETSYCKRLFTRNPGLILETAFIRPEDLRHYTELIDYFKIASRNAASPEHIELLLAAYTTGKYEGNLFDLVSSDGIAAVQAMGLPVFIDNSRLPDDFFNYRARRRGEWIAREPIDIADVFGTNNT